jgi:putative oxygen-independent coproporphyrinogen III oxidase
MATSDLSYLDELTPLPVPPPQGGRGESGAPLSEKTQVSEPFGVYVHWPFCLAKCPYCDFNSHVRHGGINQGMFLPAYLAELAHFESLATGRTVSSVFFGGGTPSLMAPKTVDAILDRISELWTVAADAEITLEANPTSVEAERFAGYRTAGINRLSLGVQSLDDASLKALGRKHTSPEALAALAIAKRNFERVSFDLIYARQGQSLLAWRDELTRALSHAQDHLSLYQLTIEAGTPFAALHAAGALTVPDGGHAETFYILTQELCDDAGLPAYEVSNHARAGAESRHNLLYWRGHDYVGIGPGAHSRITRSGTRRALAVRKSPEAWLEAVAMSGHGIEQDEALNAQQSADEYLLMGLRLAEGVDVTRLAAIDGRKLDEGRLAQLESQGLLRRSEDRVQATDAGRLVLDRLIVELAA